MPPARCPSCDTPLTGDEFRSGRCPMCGAGLQGIQADAPRSAPPAYDRAAPADQYPPGGYDDYSRPAVEVSDELKKARKETAGVLFAIGILNLICYTILLAAAPQIVGGPLPRELIVFAVVEMIAITLVFAGLGWWALYQPLIPAIIGLVLYVGLTILTIASNPQMATRGIYVRVVFIALLIRAIVISAKAMNTPRRQEW